MELKAKGEGVDVAGSLEGDGEGEEVGWERSAVHLGEEEEGGEGEGEAEVGAHEGVPVEVGEEEVAAEEVGVNLGHVLRVGA